MNLADFELNIVDLVALLVILLAVVAGVKQGFVSGFLDLVGMVAGFYFAFKGYGPVGGFAADYLPLPRGIANLAAFMSLFVISQGVFSLVSGFLWRGIKHLLYLFPVLRLVNAVAGALPGLVKGLVAITLLLLAFGLFPVIPQVKAEIEQSAVGNRIIAIASKSAPRLESLLGQTVEDTLTFLSRSQPGKPIRLNLPVPSSLEVDAGSEQKMLELVNAERTKANLQPLVTDERLRAAARGHSKEMFELSYFAHESLVSGNPADRMSAEGARFTLAAENLAYAPNVEIAHNGLMNSPGHRKNILTPGLRRIGIGVIDGGLKGKMFTQNFTD